MITEEGKYFLYYEMLVFAQFILFLLKIFYVLDWGWAIILIPLWILIGIRIIVPLLFVFVLWLIGKNDKEK